MANFLAKYQILTFIHNTKQIFKSGKDLYARPFTFYKSINRQTSFPPFKASSNCSNKTPPVQLINNYIAKQLFHQFEIYDMMHTFIRIYMICHSLTAVNIYMYFIVCSE